MASANTASANIEAKARRLLVDGRIEVLRVRPKNGLVVAECQGDHDVYQLGYDPDDEEWRCNCPARVRVCSHLLALQKVTGNGRFAQPRRPDPEDDAATIRHALRVAGSGGWDGEVLAALDRLAGRR